MESNKILEKARAYAFLLLKYRLRSKKELGDRLRRRKFPEETIEKVVSSLEEKGYLDDTAFAKAWIASRTGQKFGAGRIRRELRFKGVDPDLVEEGLRESEEARPEEQTVREIAEEKFRKLKGLEPKTAKRRIYAYFLRRGFSPDTITDIINGLT
ncbi:MAG: regulatory protein RecX [Deltaproteobacteria bacterium]